MLYKLLEFPVVYSLSQRLLAPGAEYFLHRRLERLTREHPLRGRVLDIGCGPASWLQRLGASPIGLDLSWKYSEAYRKGGGQAVTGSAAELPFADRSFDSIWCIGVLHHLPSSLARKAVREMLRVRGRNGRIVVLDAVLPRHPWRRPVARLIRGLDRGGFMRTEREITALLEDAGPWSTRRFTYTLNGLELLECVSG